jgi:phosphatidylinositol 4-kinase
MYIPLISSNLGYVARFIFEMAKISQLFCHQIIWNMKANCYKDDSAEIVCSKVDLHYTA